MPAKFTPTTLVRSTLAALGLRLSRIPSPDTPGVSLQGDIQRLAGPARMIFDVGANRGQSIVKFKTLYPAAAMHCFEPDATALLLARAVAERYADVVVNDLAVGDKAGKKTFNIYDQSDMSSFLEPGASSWAKVERKATVTVTTIDAYCAARAIDHIDILKIDTQGFDGSVLTGAKDMLQKHRIGVIQTELNFFNLYEGQSSPSDMIAFMAGCGYRLAGLHEFNYRDGMLAWCDGLFARLPDKF